jgi:hypothetical protein
MHLSHAEVGIRDKLHKCIVVTLSVAHLSKRVIPSLLVLVRILQNTGRNAQVALLANFVRIKFLQYVAYSGQFQRLFRLDAEWFDIPLEEEQSHLSHRLARQYIGIDAWPAQETYDNTGFRPDQLRKVYGLFGLEDMANQEPHVGSILVPTGHGRHYHFYPEELFMFLFVKCRTGHNNKHLCAYYFGGHAARWTFGFRWIVRYLDQRYQRTLSHEKLACFLPQFGQFYEAISAYMQQSFDRQNHDGSTNDHDGLNHCPLPIFGFIDCSIDKTCRPHSGPDGNYVGAPRKEFQDEYQRAVYTGFKKYHGIKMETLELPNGISTVFGPTSTRIHDVGGVLQMSQLDNFLVALQAGQPTQYYAFGDGAYNANYLERKSVVLLCADHIYYFN